MSMRSLASLMLAPVLLAATVYAALVAMEHPDEATATRQWIALTREQALRVPSGTPRVSHLPAGETESLSPDLPDPFQLEDDAPVPAPTSRQARNKASPPLESEEDEDVATVLAPSPSSAAAPPARPALRLLGTLRRNEHWTALVELDGATRRLQVGDQLPGALGEVLAVHEDQIAIRHAGAAHTISMENYAASTLPAATPYGRNTHLAPRAQARRLIRPGGRR